MSSEYDEEHPDGSESGEQKAQTDDAAEAGFDEPADLDQRSDGVDQGRENSSEQPLEVQQTGRAPSGEEPADWDQRGDEGFVEESDGRDQAHADLPDPNEEVHEPAGAEEAESLAEPDQWMDEEFEPSRGGSNGQGGEVLEPAEVGPESEEFEPSRSGSSGQGGEVVEPAEVGPESEEFDPSRGDSSGQDGEVDEPAEMGPDDSEDVDQPVADPTEQNGIVQETAGSAGVEETRELSREEPVEALDQELARHLENSEITSAGRAFYEPGDSRMYEAAALVPPDHGRYTVDMHGDSEHVYIGDAQLSPDELAVLLEHDPQYDGGSVSLFACETGQTDDGFAAQLSNRLGVPVLAPTELAWSTSLGDTYVTSAGGVDVFGDPIPTRPHDGTWRLFNPDDERGR